MNPEELRIGNVCETNGYYCMVDVISYSNGVRVINGYTIDKINSIPLTPEWLGRLGFDKVGEEDWVKADLTISRNVLRNVFVWDPYCDVKHVHQLQNLYFALTGEEL